MNIKEIQEWEKEFAKKKNLPPKNKDDAPEVLRVAFFKLSEEVGELAEAILKENHEEIPPEVADIIIFACKIAKVTEDYFHQPSLSVILEKKIDYAEKREYDKKESDLTKPGGGFKKGE